MVVDDGTAVGELSRPTVDAHDCRDGVHLLRGSR